MTSLSLSIQLSQYNSTGTESGNGGQLNEKSQLKKSDLFLKVSRNNWHGVFCQLSNLSRERTRTRFFHHSSTLNIDDGCTLITTRANLVFLLLLLLLFFFLLCCRDSLIAKRMC